MIAGVEKRSETRVNPKRVPPPPPPRGWRALSASWAAAGLLHVALLAVAATLTSVLARPSARQPALILPFRLALGGTGAAAHDPLPGGRESVASRRPAVPDLPPGEIDSGEPPRVSGDADLLAGPPPGHDRARGEDLMAGHVPEHAGHGRAGASRGARWGGDEGSGSSGGTEAASGGAAASASSQTGSAPGDGGDGWARRRGGRLPAYPAVARRRGWEGTATLTLDIAADGTVSAVRVAESSGHSLLDESAEEAALTWTFAPALRDGRPEASRVTMPVTFRLTD